MSRGRELLGLACQRARLKPRVSGADMHGMFAARQRPLLLVEDRLLALRMSLNAPVLATAELPAGPARAAIVVHTQGASRCFSIVVRSLRNGTSVIYELEGEDLREDSGWAVALDASLSFGESMGFLFDDEMLVDRRPETLRRAITRLHEILAPPDVSDEDPLAASVPRITEDARGEILLDDELDNAAQDSDALGSELTGPLEALPPDSEHQGLRPLPVARPLQLSKFRSAPPERVEVAGREAPGPLDHHAGREAPGPLDHHAGREAPGPPVLQAEPSASSPASAKPAARARGGATLGRVRPVRRRTQGADAPAKLDPLLRLLADF
jgi:hypothetical protein